MPSYRALVRPSANRVYAQQAPALACAELTALSTLALDNRLVAPEVLAEPGLPPFVRLTTDEPLDDEALAVIATASTVMVLFEERDGLLAPIPAAPPAVYDDDLLTTLKYGGKTNEQFTALLVNLALAATDRGYERMLAGEPLRLLDPVCGRGTSLNQALVYGLDAAGVDASTKELEIYVGFLRQYLRDHRVKHRSEAARVKTGKRHTITITRPAPAAPKGGIPQVVDVIADDTTAVRDHLGGSSVDLVVGDLPYGVQHGARSEAWDRSRSPEAMLADALPVWRAVLRGGGAICLAYNRRTLAPHLLRDLVHAAKFDLVTFPEGVSFEHRVDRSIQRDVVLARKPS